VDRLQDMVGGAAAASDMLASHPQLLTRPPAALEQQLINLAAWLRLPAPNNPQSQAGAVPAASGCQDLMDLVRTTPGVLFLSKQQVTGQLEAMQQLLGLPSLGQLPEEEIAVSQQLLAEHMQQQHDAGGGSQGVVQSDAADYQFLINEQAWFQQQHQQHEQQFKKALKTWRKAAQQHQGAVPAAAATAAGGGSVGALPWDDWPGRLVCHAPEWLFVDPHATMPRRIDYLARLLFGRTVTTGSSNSSSSSTKSSVSTLQDKTLSSLLLYAPQLISVNPSSVSGRIQSLRKVLQQHPGYALQQQWQQQQLNAGPGSKQGSTAKKVKQKGKRQQLPGGDLVPLLLQSPLLLVQQAKQLEKNGAELLQQLPGLPLYHLLLLLPQPELHWQQLQFLQHMHLLPAASPASSNTPAAAEWSNAHLQLATDALSLQPAVFVANYPQYPAWQAAMAAAAASSRDWRAGWGWQRELQGPLSGPACKAWLQQLDGKWQRLLLLAAGEAWLQARPVAAAPAAAAAVKSSSGGGSRRRRSSRASSSSLGAGTAAIAASGLPGAVSLRQVAALSGCGFPYMPAAAAGPIPWDLPQQAILQLLSGSRAALDSELSKLAAAWGELAAAAGNAAWQQQLGDAAGLLPQALVAAGWKLPAGVSKALTSSSSSSSSKVSKSSGNQISVTASWAEECMESRAAADSPTAAAALTVRQQFWQHLQQPGVLRQLTSRLHFIQSAGLADSPQQQQQGSSSSSIHPSSVWSVLAASDAAFTAACPEFTRWQQLQSLVSDKPGWADELAALQGQQLLHWLQQAAAGWWRLAYLSSDDAGEDGGIWQAISMTDALEASNAAFTDMFPEARYSSWQVLAQLRDEDGSSSSSATAPDKGPAVASPFAQDEQDAAAAGKSSGRVQLSKKPRAETAAQRLQLLQDYASLHPAWEAELRGWKKETWSTAARTFVPLKARRLEYVLQTVDPPGSDANSSSSSVADGAAGAGGAAAPQLPDLQLVVTSANVHFLKRFPLFLMWNKLGNAVQAVPRWSAEWHALRGNALQQLLQEVEQLQAPDPQAVRQHACEQHLALLRSKLAALHQQQGGSVDVLQLPTTGQASLLKHPSLTQVGVTGISNSSSSSNSSSKSLLVDEDSAAWSKKDRARAAALAARHGSRQHQQQQRQLHGLELALHRVNYFSSDVRAAKAAKDLPLQQLLLMPQEQLLQFSPGLDPVLAAAQSQGTADAESQFLEEVYPWLGLKALSPEVQQGLSSKGVRLLEERLSDLLLLQQLAHTWPAWEQQLQGYGPKVVEQLLPRMRLRSERLQVLVR
jgi:hypothetical protein